MWTASIAFKVARTDGGVGFFVEFTDGVRKFKKEYTFFSDFDLSAAVGRDIDTITKLYNKFDSTSEGAISIPPKDTSSPDTTIRDILKLRQLKLAADLGLIQKDDPAIAAQITIVSANPDYLSKI